MENKFDNYTDKNVDSMGKRNADGNTVDYDVEEGTTGMERRHTDNTDNKFENYTDSNTDTMGNPNHDNVYDVEEGTTGRERRDLDKVLVGVFETENEAIKVIGRLKEIGYREDEITVLAKDKAKMDRIDDETNVDTDAPGDGSGVGTGAAIGGALGGMAALLPALGLLAIPGVGPVLAAGPIVGILGGIVAGGVAGGLVGALVDMGVRKEDAKEYELQLDQGKIIILVENRDNLSDDVYSTYNQNNSTVNSRNR
jgi:uncharacterized membrane protein